MKGFLTIVLWLVLCAPLVGVSVWFSTTHHLGLLYDVLAGALIGYLMMSIAMKVVKP